MPLHVYSIWVKAVTPICEKWLPIRGPFLNATQNYAPLPAVLKWLDEQRGALDTEICRAREMGGDPIGVTARLPVPGEGLTVGYVNADQGDPLEELKREVQKRYPRES